MLQCDLMQIWFALSGMLARNAVFVADAPNRFATPIDMNTRDAGTKTPVQIPDVELHRPTYSLDKSFRVLLLQFLTLAE